VPLRKYRFLDVLNLVSVGGIAQLKQAFAAEEAYRPASLDAKPSVSLVFSPARASTGRRN
jgi:hypothetical protein